MSVELKHLGALTDAFADELSNIAKEKQAGLFNRMGKGVASIMGSAKGARGALPPPPVAGKPQLPSLDAAKDVGKKALMGAGVMGIGAAGSKHLERKHEKAMAERGAYGM